MSLSFIQKQKNVQNFFSSCTTLEETYEKIIDFGRGLTPLPSEQKTAANRVEGCQSTLYLYTQEKEGHLYFLAEADALIAAGLARLFIDVYSGEAPEVLLQQPPDYLDELGIPSILSPGRANGLYSLHLRMKQEALHTIIPSQ